MKKMSNLTLMLRLIKLVKPLSGYMVLAIIMGFIGHICASFITILGGYVLVKLLGFSVDLSLAVIFIIMGLFAILRGVLRYAEQACNHFIAFKLLSFIRDKVFKALRKLCPAKLEGKDKGDLISIITSDIELLEVFYAHTISPAAIAFLFSLLMCLFIGSFHWILGIIALAAYVSVGVVIPIFTSKLSGQDGANIRMESGELSSFVLDSLRGLPEIMQYGAGKKRLAEMNEKTDALSASEECMKRKAGKSTAVTNAVILLFDATMLFTAAALYQNNVLDFAGVILPVIALMSSFGPTLALANLGSTLQNTFAAGRRVLDILDETPVTEEISGHKRITFDGASLSNVTFSYGKETILSDISFDIDKGSIIGISGKSGSGKSTLLKLIMRFWKVEEGEIEISKTSINNINTANLREMESFVTQETHLFHDSIANNIRIAKLDATDKEIEAACKKASVHDFIASLPRGYSTNVGELGNTLSSGERQRMGLARAFLHNAPFMLLDEPTSNLDSLNEAIILKSLCECQEDKTVLLVSHRQSTMRIADEVYSIENGRMS